MSDPRFRNVLEKIPEPLVVVRSRGELCFANAAARELFGGGEVPTRPLGNFPRAGTSQLSLYPPLGGVRVQRVAVAAAEWEDESAYVATFQDISELELQMEAEASLRRSEARRHLILDSSIDCIVMTDADDHIVEFNPAAEATFGYSRGEVLGRAMTGLLVAPAEQRAFHENQRRRLADGAARRSGRRFEINAIRRDGTAVPVEAAISLAQQGGQAVFTIVLHDITHRRQEHHRLLWQTQALRGALEALERARERERQMLATASSILIGVDDRGEITHWNPAAEKALGVAAAEAIGKPLFGLGIGWPADQISLAMRQCNESGAAQAIEDLHLTDRAGRERILTLSMNRIQSQSDEDFGVLVVARDITEQKALEAQLILAHKMESIGQLAAGIAHEINTPTQYVSDNVSFLRDAFRDFCLALERYEQLRHLARQGPVDAAVVEQMESFLDEIDLPFLRSEVPRAIEQSLEGLSRVAEIVRAMKQFSHPDQDELELTDINGAIENTAMVARNEWKYVADLKFDFDADLPAIPCLLGRFNQAILNLIVNAAHAIGEARGADSQAKGEIVITTRRDGAMVEIRVADTGAGIPARIRNRIFDPFFTTKQVGKGTGQGLAMVHGIIVEKHHGTITFESEEGKGTTFLVRLPLAAAEKGGAARP